MENPTFWAWIGLFTGLAYGYIIGHIRGYRHGYNDRKRSEYYKLYRG